MIQFVVRHGSRWSDHVWLGKAIVVGLVCLAITWVWWGLRDLLWPPAGRGVAWLVSDIIEIALGVFWGVTARGFIRFRPWAWWYALVCYVLLLLSGLTSIPTQGSWGLLLWGVLFLLALASQRERFRRD